MTLSRRSFLKGILATSAATLVGPTLLSAAFGSETAGTWKVSGSHWGAFRARIYAGGFSNVSNQSMIIRLQDLGLVKNETQARLSWTETYSFS